MTTKLTKKIVDELPMPTKGQCFYWDKNLSGFGLRVTPSKKTYIVQARLEGKTRRITIGSTHLIAADKAREKALTLLAQLSQGKDPQAEKRRRKAANTTLREVADQYIELKRTKRGQPLKPISKADIDRHIRTTFNDWSDKPIAKITPAMVDKKYQAALTVSEAQAVQGFRIFRAVYNWQRANTETDEGIPTMPENPCRIIGRKTGWAHIPAKDRRIPLLKVGAVWTKLKSVYADPGQTEVGQTMAAAVMFAFLTGGRWGEVTTLTWNQIDLEAATWRLPDPKNRKPITFPLSHQAIDILKHQVGQHDHLVFPGRGKAGHIQRPTRLMGKLAAVCGVAISAHDLRRTFNAIAEECGIEFWKQKVLLGHTVGADVTLSNYKETSDLSRLAPDVQKIADWIEQQATAKPTGKVIAFKPRKTGS
jgi:integrase